RTGGADRQVEENGLFVISGNLFGPDAGGRVTAFGISIQRPGEFPAGETVELRDGGSLTVEADGSYRLISAEPFEGMRGQRLFYTAALPPEFTLANYEEVLASEGIGQSF